MAKAKKAKEKSAKQRQVQARVETVADEPSPTMILKLQERGPLAGESYLAFEVKLASLKRGRELWLEAYRASGGLLTRTCGILGIANSNGYKSLAAFGLSREILDEAVETGRDLDTAVWS